MNGDGTEQLWSQLSFACKFRLSFVSLRTAHVAKTCECSLTVDVDANTWEPKCPCVSGFKSQMQKNSRSILMRCDSP